MVFAVVVAETETADVVACIAPPVPVMAGCSMHGDDRCCSSLRTCIGGSTWHISFTARYFKSDSSRMPAEIAASTSLDNSSLFSTKMLQKMAAMR